jgi:hypothetical protein
MFLSEEPRTPAWKATAFVDLSTTVDAELQEFYLEQ